MRTQAADWGFDVFDLEWDVVAFVPRRVWFLRFREGFDFAGVAARLESYGFSSEQLAHGVLWTAPQGFPRVGDRIVGNADMEASGFLDDGRTMLASPGGADELRAILTEGPTPLADLSLQSVGRLLGAPFAASIIVPSDCRQLVMQAYAEASPAVRHEVEAMLAAARPLHSPNALGVGYQRTDRPLGRIVVGYAQDGEARDDLERRSTLATMGISAISRDTAVLYRDRLFVVADSRVEERAIVFDVAQAPLPTPTASLPPLAATETLPRLLMGQIASRRDMLFAAC